jgi:hypothetical protein
MADSYHINDDKQVIPYSGGRMSTDTDSWRDATELEIEQQLRIEKLEKRIDRCRDYLMSVGAKEINVPDTLMALGFTSNGLDELEA